MFYKKQLLVIDTEATYGTVTSAVTTPTATYFMKVINPQLKINGEVVERPFINDTWGRYAHRIGKRSIELTFQHEMTHFMAAVGAINNTTVEGRLLKAAGLKETYTSETAVTYAPSSDSTDHKSVCGRLYYDGFYVQFYGGVVKTAKLIIEGGKPFMWEFTVVAKYVQPVDFTNFPSETYPTYLPNTVIGTQDSSLSVIVGKYEFTIENTIAEKPELGDESNISSFAITDRSIKCKLDMEAVKVATFNTFGAFMDATEIDISLEDISDVNQTWANIVASNKLQLISPPNFVNREGILAHDIEFQCNRNTSGNDEILITYGYIAP